MSIYINVFPIIKVPNEIQMLRVFYSESIYKQYKNSSYRIGNNLYIYNAKAKKGEKIIFKKGLKEFSLIFQHLVLKSLKNNICSKDKYEIKEWGRRLSIIRKEPSIKTDYVEISEGIAIQTIHWQDVNFAIIVDYLTRNNFTEKFKTEKLDKNTSLPAPSYSNFYKYLSYDEAKDIMIKIGELRGEKVRGRMRSDALEQRMFKIKEYLMDFLNWREGEVYSLPLPTGEKIAISSKNVEIILLSSKENAYE